jgi:Flp pilus assembly protein TadD
MADSDRKLAVTYFANGDYEQAIVAFTEAIQDDSENPDLYKARAACYRAAGDDASAATDISKAQELRARAGTSSTSNPYRRGVIR